MGSVLVCFAFFVWFFWRFLRFFWCFFGLLVCLFGFGFWGLCCGLGVGGLGVVGFVLFFLGVGVVFLVGLSFGGWGLGV